ncbi:UDP-N-acetylglucosamine 2-epimerase [Lysobacter sp. A286]
MLASASAGYRIDVQLTGQHHESMSELANDLGVGHYFPSEDLQFERSTVFKLVTWFPRALMNCRKRLKAVSGNGRALVLVHGDTASTFLGALAARSLGLPVVHIESGLSSGALFDPFPEELLRRLVFRLTTIAFCPDQLAFDRMKKYSGLQVHNSGGNTIADALLLAMTNRKSEDELAEVVVSIHRFENIRNRDRLARIVGEVFKIADGKSVSFVLHPATLTKLRDFGLYDKLDSHRSISLVPRMSYSRFIGLASAAEVVITDGGSNQEEFALLGIPTLILRERSERPDGLGANAMLEHGFGAGGLAAFVLEGKAAMLRKPAVLKCNDGVSGRIVAMLSGYSIDDDGAARAGK